jgi:hypothetical protein
MKWPEKIPYPEINMFCNECELAGYDIRLNLSSVKIGHCDKDGFFITEQFYRIKHDYNCWEICWERC